MRHLSAWGSVFVILMTLVVCGTVIDAVCWMRFGTILGTASFLPMSAFLWRMGAFDGWRDRMWER